MFKKSMNHLKSVNYLALIAIFIALKIAIGTFFIPVGDNLRVYFTFAITAVESAIIGPIPALVSGFVSDLLGFLIHPFGPFFAGYVLSSMLGSLVYALFLYDTTITITKLALAKTIVNLFVNALLGSIWSTILYSKGFIFYVSSSLIKNIALLPFEILGLVLLFNALIPFLEKKNLIPPQPTTTIPWFSSSK